MVAKGHPRASGIYPESPVVPVVSIAAFAASSSAALLAASTEGNVQLVYPGPGACFNASRYLPSCPSSPQDMMMNTRLVLPSANGSGR